FDELEVLARPESGLFERFTFLARPALPRRGLGNGRCINHFAEDYRHASFYRLKYNTRPCIITFMNAMLFAVLLAAGAAAQAADIPRLPDGKPDLNGVWERPFVPDM